MLLTVIITQLNRNISLIIIHEEAIIHIDTYYAELSGNANRLDFNNKFLPEM